MAAHRYLITIRCFELLKAQFLKGKRFIEQVFLEIPSGLFAQQQYAYVLCIWQPYFFFILYGHLCIPCLEDIVLFPYLS